MEEHLERVKKAYKACLSLRHKHRKTIPYDELDYCLYIVEKYIQWMENE